MTSIYQNPTLHRRDLSKKPASKESYSGYLEPDTEVPPKPAQVIKDVTVNDVMITESAIMAEAQNHPAATPGAALALAAQALAVRELLLQEASRIGIAVSRENTVSQRSETAEDASIRLLIEQEVSVPQVTEQECRRVYELNKHRFRSDTIHEARHILFAVERDDIQAREAARVKAQRLAGFIADHPDEFAKLAAEYSDCPSAQQGGNLGQLTAGSTVSEFESALAGMTPGVAAPGLVDSRFGIHLVVLDRRIDATPLPFEVVREKIAAWLEASSWSRAVAQYIGILAGQARISGVEITSTEGSLVQ